MDNERPTYVVMVRAEPGIDAVRALRAWLKIGLRRLGLRCVEVQEGKQQGRMKMDMRDYAPKKIGPDEVRDGPIQTQILSVFENEKTGRPVLELANGSTFMLNATNCNILIKAWGVESDDWKEREIEFSLGSYKDLQDRSNDKETVKVRAIPPAKPRPAMAASRASLRCRQAGEQRQARTRRCAARWTTTSRSLRSGDDGMSRGRSRSRSAQKEDYAAPGRVAQCVRHLGAAERGVKSRRLERA